MIQQLNIRNFSAWINLQPPGPFELIVKGEVETDAANMVPKLACAQPQGINPQHLILDLGIVDTDAFDTQNVAFRPVRYEKPASSGDYTSVEIRRNGTILQSLKVSEVQ